MYRPSEIDDLSKKFTLLIPKTMKVSGIEKLVYPTEYSKCPQIYCNFKTYGGTEVISNGIITIVDTGVILTWYRSDITINCKLIDIKNNKVYIVKSEPEIINDLYLKFKIERIGSECLVI